MFNPFGGGPPGGFPGLPGAGADDMPMTLREMALREQGMEGYGRPGMGGGMPPWAQFGREPEGYVYDMSFYVNVVSCFYIRHNSSECPTGMRSFRRFRSALVTSAGECPLLPSSKILSHSIMSLPRQIRRSRSRLPMTQRWLAALCACVILSKANAAGACRVFICSTRTALMIGSRRIAHGTRLSCFRTTEGRHMFRMPFLAVSRKDLTYSLCCVSCSPVCKTDIVTGASETRKESGEAQCSAAAMPGEPDFQPPGWGEELGAAAGMPGGYGLGPPRQVTHFLD